MTPIEILQQHKIKKTSPRVAIIQALQNKKHPLSEADIKEIMGELYDRITFYRNIQTLMEAGILHRIIIDNVQVKYALNQCEKGNCHHANHVHFHCKVCNEVTCMEEIDIKTAIPKGYIPDDFEMLIKGTCIRCNKTN